MSEYDGEVLLGVKLKPKDIQQSAKSLSDTVGAVFKANAGKQLDSSLMKIQAKMSKLTDQSKVLNKTIDELASKRVESEEFSSLTKQMEKLDKSAETVVEKMSRLEDVGKDNWTDAQAQSYEALQTELSGIRSEYDSLYEEQLKLIDAGKSLVFTNDEDAKHYENALSKLNDINNQRAIANAQWNEASRKYEDVISTEKALQLAEEETGKQAQESSTYAERSAQQWQNAMNLIKQSVMNVPALLKSIPSAAANAFQSLGTSVISAIKNIPGLVASTLSRLPEIFRNVAITGGKILQSAFSKSMLMAKKLASTLRGVLRSALKTVTSHFSKLHKQTGLSNISAGKFFRTILKYGLGIRSLYALFNKLRNAIKEGINNLVFFNDGANKTNESMSKLTSSLATLKNSLGAMAAPLINAVTPALTKIIDKTTEATQVIGKFIAALTGQSTFIQAKKVQKDYAKSLEDESKKAKKAKKESEGYLSTIDEINKFQTKKTDEDEEETKSPGDDFMEVPIDSKIKDWVNKFKEAWKNADFTDIGAAIGKKLKDALDSINWDFVKETAGKLGKSLATFLNGIINTEGLGDTIGKSIAEAFNTAIEFVRNFIENLDWEGLGKFVSDGINSFVNNFDWEGLGKTVGEAINGVFTFLLTAIENTDWHKLGSSMMQALMNAIKEVDWELVGKTAASTINMVVKFVRGLVDTFDPLTIGESFATAINTAIKKIDWANLGSTISEGVKKLLDLFITFVEKVDWKAFGESVKTMLKNIDWAGVISRMFEAIGAVLGGLAAFLWGLIEEAWNDVKKWWFDVAYKDGEFTIQGLLNGIVEALKNIGNWILKNIWEPFKKGFCTAFGIASPSKKTKEFGSYIIQGLKDGIQAGVQGVLNIVNTLKEKLFSMFNAIIATEEKMINGVIRGINWLIDKLNDIHIDVPDWMSEAIDRLAGVYVQSIGFDIGKLSTISLPRLAQGAVIPPNKEFMAMLGDQKQGMNIETPLETMKQAFREAIAETGGGNGVKTIQFILPNKQLIAEYVIEGGRILQSSRGSNPFELA